MTEAAESSCLQVREKMDQGQVTLNKFIITKQLTKRPEDYPDAHNQPHVQVALRRAKENKRDGIAQVRPPKMSLPYRRRSRIVKSVNRYGYFAQNVHFTFLQVTLQREVALGAGRNAVTHSCLVKVP
jgi:hypothetical protein